MPYLTLHMQPVSNSYFAIAAADDFWATSAPTLTLDVAPGTVWAGDSAQLSATLSCGEQGFSGEEVTFVLEHGSWAGALADSQVLTDGSGVAETTVNTQENRRLTERIDAEFEWRQPFGRRPETIAAFAPLRLFSLAGDWAMTGQESVQSCGDPEDNGLFTGTGAVTLSQLGSTFTGTAEFPTILSLFQGDVARGEGGGKSVPPPVGPEAHR